MITSFSRSSVASLQLALLAPFGSRCAGSQGNAIRVMSLRVGASHAAHETREARRLNISRVGQPTNRARWGCRWE